VPESPKLLYVLEFAFFGGLAFGGALVLLSYARDRWGPNRRMGAERLSQLVSDAVTGAHTANYEKRKRLLRWCIRPFLLLVAVTMLAVAVLNITLWLQDREEYEQWRRAPVSYVAGKAADFVELLRQRS
jgi:hypothetical protein